MEVTRVFRVIADCCNSADNSFGVSTVRLFAPGALHSANEGKNESAERFHAHKWVLCGTMSCWCIRLWNYCSFPFRLPFLNWRHLTWQKGREHWNEPHVVFDYIHEPIGRQSWLSVGEAETLLLNSEANCGAVFGAHGTVIEWSSIKFIVDRTWTLSCKAISLTIISRSDSLIYVGVMKTLYSWLRWGIVLGSCW